MSVVGVIPARLQSSRFPGKPLVELLDRPMIWWVHEAVRAAQLVDEVLVATGDESIERVSSAFGARVMRTSSSASNGSERVGELLASSSANIWVNVQCDEPLLRSRDIDAVVAALDDGSCSAATLAAPLTGGQLDDPNCVKVVCTVDGRALYFSRAAIPYRRTPLSAPPLLHVGIYAYRRDALARYISRAPTPLELAEGLEQLRLLEHGESIRVVARTEPLVSVNTPEDRDQVEQILLTQAALQTSAARG